MNVTKNAAFKYRFGCWLPWQQWKIGSIWVIPSTFGFRCPRACCLCSIYPDTVSFYHPTLWAPTGVLVSKQAFCPVHRRCIDILKQWKEIDRQKPDLKSVLQDFTVISKVHYQDGVMHIGKWSIREPSPCYTHRGWWFILNQLKFFC